MEREPGQRDAEAKEEMLQRGGGQLLLKAEIKKKKNKNQPASFRYGVIRPFLIFKHAVLEEWLDRSQNALGT